MQREAVRWMKEIRGILRSGVAGTIRANPRCLVRIEDKQ
jgi:hypothetical protein